MGKELNKTSSLIIVTIIYIAASVIGIIVYRSLDWHLVPSLFLADVVSTVFVFVFSCIFSNASVYDPYWSVQPLVIAVLFICFNGSGTEGILLTAVIAVWSIRLTGNWVYTFKGMTKYEDWRYVMLREKTGKFYPVINFTGIHLVPTVIVFLCTLPVVYAIDEKLPVTAVSVLFSVLSVGSVALELFSDSAMHKFKREGRTGFIRDGLWKYSRHPNYLGEISFWWFIALSAVFSGVPWYYIGGAFFNTVLFLTASIPMAEKRQSLKEGFEDYRKETRILLPLKK